jgi:hypothetical protein
LICGKCFFNCLRLRSVTFAPRSSLLRIAPNAFSDGSGSIKTKISSLLRGYEAKGFLIVDF